MSQPDKLVYGKAVKIVVEAAKVAQSLLMVEGSMSLKDSCGAMAHILIDMADFAAKGYEELPEELSGGDLAEAEIKEAAARAHKRRGTLE